MKIASVKKNRPSTANGMPNAAPHLPMNLGHSSPNSKLRTVPVTAPTANVTAMYFDQRWASSSASSSSCRIARQLAISVMQAQDTPRGTRMMWLASVNAIWARAHGTGSTASTCPPTRASALIASRSRCYAAGRSGHARCIAGARSCQPFEQVIADTEGVGHRRERRVHGADAGEEARVDDVQVVDLVRTAVDVEHRRRGIGPEPAGAGLVGAAGDGDVGLQVRMPGDEVVRVHAEVAEHRLELVVQPVAGGLVSHFVAESDAAVGLEGDAVVGPGQVLGRQPEVDGVGGDVAQDPRGRELRLERFLAPVHLLGRLADHLDVAHRELEVLGAEVEVVDAERLLEDGRVGLA